MSLSSNVLHIAQRMGGYMICCVCGYGNLRMYVLQHKYECRMFHRHILNSCLTPQYTLSAENEFPRLCDIANSLDLLRLS